MPNVAVGQAKSLYDRLASRREPFLCRARDAAKLTIPSLMPPEGHTRTNMLAAPYQGIGARGVNNLASKLLLSLFPPNAPFFRFKVDEYAEGVIEQIGDAKSEVELALGQLTNPIMDELERIAFRVHAHEALKQLVVTGNILMFLPDKGGARNFLLNQYVVDRDPMGSLETIVIKEMVAPEVLAARNVVIEDASKEGEDFNPDNELEIYTIIFRAKKNTFFVWQEYDGKEIQGSRGRYQEKSLPWIPLRFSKLANESYGRGLIEEYQGPLKAAEGLTKSILEGSAASARLIGLVNPNGSTKAADLNSAPNGGFVPGNAEDVEFLQVLKHADLSVAERALDSLESTLGSAFLLNSSLIRHSERTTAEEVRFTAQELEDTLGGVYSVLSLEFQTPVVNRTIAKLKRQRRFPPLPKSVSPSIITGLEALGRNHELNSLDAYITGAVQVLGEAAIKRIEVGDYMTRRATALGIDPEGLVTTDEEFAQQEQQAALAAAAQSAAPQLAKGAVDAANAQTQES